MRPDVEIRREFLLEDAFRHLAHKGEDIKQRLRIQFVDTNYIIEEGVDGGGLFKEFMTLVTQQAFDPQYACFDENDRRELSPNYHNTESLAHFRFCGVIVGKALYEGILLKTKFNDCFLNLVTGKINHFDDLASVDPVLHKHLTELKYTPNADCLGLTFAVEEKFLGVDYTVNLKPNGG